MTARFDSTCPACGRRIAAGSPIRKDWRWGRYVHSACVQSLDWSSEDEREYQRGRSEVLQAQRVGPAGSAGREQAYLELEARWAREGFDG